MKTTPTLLAELKVLSGQAGENAFHRIELAKEVLSDNDWIATVHGGNETTARVALEAEFFGDLCGSTDLCQLLEILREFPRKEQWAERKYNLKTLWAETWNRRPKQEKPERRVVKAADFDKLKEEKEQAEFRLKALEQQAKRAEHDHKNVQAALTEIRQSKDETISALKARIQDLEAENRQLRQRLTQLEVSPVAAA